MHFDRVERPCDRRSNNCCSYCTCSLHISKFFQCFDIFTHLSPQCRRISPTLAAVLAISVLRGTRCLLLAFFPRPSLHAQTDGLPDITRLLDLKRMVAFSQLMRGRPPAPVASVLHHFPRRALARRTWPNLAGPSMHPTCERWRTMSSSPCVEHEALYCANVTFNTDITASKTSLKETAAQLLATPPRARWLDDDVSVHIHEGRLAACHIIFR